MWSPDEPEPRQRPVHSCKPGLPVSPIAMRVRTLRSMRQGTPLPTIERNPIMTQKTILRSDELSCPSCVPKIEKALNALPGVAKAEVRFNTGKIEVEHDPAQSSVEALVEAVRGTGYEAQPAAF